MFGIFSWIMAAPAIASATLAVRFLALLFRR